MTNFTELYIDNAYILLRNRNTGNVAGARTDQDAHLLRSAPFLGICPANLERVSIKGVTVKGQEVDSEHQPLSQQVIIQFVRDSPSLRWLRSDLTEQNVAMLQQERPEISFVS